MDKMVVVGDSKMIHHAALFAKSYGLKFVPVEDAHDYDNIYQSGVYDHLSYDHLIGRTSGRIVLHWCGIDAMLTKRRIQNGTCNGSLPGFIEHIAQSNTIIRDLEEIGIKAELKLRFSDRRDNYPLTPLPERFNVLMFTPKDRDFGYEGVKEIVERSQDIDFTFIGAEDAVDIDSPNINRVGYISLLDDGDKYREVFKNASCLMRFKGDTDGFPQTVMQALLLGRRVISNIDQEHVEKIDIGQEGKIIQRLREFKTMKEPDEKASSFYHTRQDINNFDFI